MFGRVPKVYHPGVARARATDTREGLLDAAEALLLAEGYAAVTSRSYHVGIVQVLLMARLPFNANSYKKFLGVPELFGERGYTPDEQRGVRPTLEINGLTSGYQGEGSKTIVPAWARAKITTRLAPGQHPAKVIKLVRAFLKKHCPPTVTLEVTGSHPGPSRLTQDVETSEKGLGCFRLTALLAPNRFAYSSFKG